MIHPSTSPSSLLVYINPFQFSPDSILKMPRNSIVTPIMHHRFHRYLLEETCARLIALLTIWICVSVILKYGFYGDFHMDVGPSSSRLFQVSGVFVKQVEVRDYSKKGVYLYGFLKKPQLTSETNWTVSRHLAVGSHTINGFYLWLNKGSRISMKWEDQATTLSGVQVSMIKRERESEYRTIMKPISSSSYHTHGLDELARGKEVYMIKEDDAYYVYVRNPNKRTIMVSVNVTISSKMYDTTKAMSSCSTLQGSSCHLNLRFPNMHFVAETVAYNGDIDPWDVELSYVARVVSYIVILVALAFFIFLMLKCIRACAGTGDDHEEENENNPIMAEKTYGLPYGTDQEDAESGKSSSSDDLYGAKICVICYDVPRNCFIVPCGHCATCYDCAQRIMNGDSKVCPICRRLIRKIRKLIIPDKNEALEHK